MMAVLAVQRLDMQRDRGIHREGVEPFTHQFGVELSDLVARKVGLEHQHGPARNVDHDARQRLVHRHVDRGIARDAGHVAERLLDRLSERDPDILRGVVMVDMQIADRLDRHVDAGMAGEQVQHVVEEANAGRDRGRARAVEVDGHLDVGFLGLALDGRGAHGV